jgi:UDP-N-acetylglucosamine 2-epimerase
MQSELKPDDLNAPMQPKKIVVVVGTRPEAIKLAPLVLVLRAESSIDLEVVSTAQHLDLLDEVFEVFDFSPDHTLNPIREDRSLGALGSHLLVSLSRLLEDIRPDIVVVHGDTSSALFGALAAFYQGIKVAHVEAGLRTGNISQPFPEEFNRRVIASIAKANFAPTTLAAANLINEGLEAASVLVTGNTIVDAIRLVKENYLDHQAWVIQRERLVTQLIGESILGATYVLVTLHRRENSGTPMEQYMQGIREFAESRPDIKFIFPVHPNPISRDPAKRILSGLANVFLTQPMDYLTFSYLLSGASMVVTDSGGIQEEAIAYSKRTIVCRTSTERPEVLESGLASLVLADSAAVFQLLQDHFSSPSLTKFQRSESIQRQNPFGDGYASERILKHLLMI